MKFKILLRNTLTICLLAFQFKSSAQLLENFTSNTASNNTHKARIGRAVAQEGFDSFVSDSFKSIPSGEFEMGREYRGLQTLEEKKHKVVISKGFEIQSKTITSAQFQYVIDYNFYRRECVRYENTFCNKRKTEILANISRFLKLINASSDQYTYRLPTEAEWEYAAKLGAIELAHAKRDDRVFYEWVKDFHAPYPDTTVVDPSGPKTGTNIVIRGINQYNRLVREYSNPKNEYSHGFRLVRELKK